VAGGRAFTVCGLTLRSSGAPTAWHTGHQAQGLRPILRLLSSAPYRWLPLTSNVRHRIQSDLLIHRPKTNTVAADIQHADAVALLAHLEVKILADPSFHMTYSDAAVAVGRKPTNAGRHTGQVTSRIDAACFYAKTPFLAMHRVRETYGQGINPRSFQTELWQAHTAGLIARAEAYVWTAEDFTGIKRHLRGLGDDSAALQWKRIEQFGQKGVNQALGLAPTA
jgi:hypothetical protein